MEGSPCLGTMGDWALLAHGCRGRSAHPSKVERSEIEAIGAGNGCPRFPLPLFLVFLLLTITVGAIHQALTWAKRGAECLMYIVP